MASKTNHVSIGLNLVLVMALCLPSFTFSNSNTRADYTALGKKVGRGVWHTAQLGVGAVSGLLSYIAATSCDRNYKEAAIYGVTSYALLSSSVIGFKKLIGKEAPAGVQAQSKTKKLIRGLWAATKLGCSGWLIGYELKNAQDVYGKIVIAIMVGTLLSNGISEFKDILAAESVSKDSKPEDNNLQIKIEEGGAQADCAA